MEQNSQQTNINQPVTGIVKCPKCKKHFTAIIQSLSGILPSKEEEIENVRQTLVTWDEGDRECPYCLNILNVTEWRAGIVNKLPEKIEEKQGYLKKGQELPPKLKTEPVVKTFYHPPIKWDRQGWVELSSDMPLKRIAHTTENQVAKIIVNYEDFIREYEREIRDSRKGGLNYQLLIEGIKKEASKSDEVDLNALVEKINIPLDFHFYRVLYPFVHTAKISLYDKENKNYVKFFIIRDHGTRAGSLAGYGGKEYKLPSGKTFLEERWRS